MKPMLAALTVGSLLFLALQAEARPGRERETRQAPTERTRSVDSSTERQASPTDYRGRFQEKPVPSAQQQANIQKLKQDLSRLKSESDVTQAQKDQLYRRA